MPIFSLIFPPTLKTLTESDGNGSILQESAGGGRVWWVDVFRGEEWGDDRGLVQQKKISSDFRSPEVGISEFTDKRFFSTSPYAQVVHLN